MKTVVFNPVFCKVNFMDANFGSMSRGFTLLCIILSFLNLESGLSEEHRVGMGAQSNIFTQVKVTDFHLRCNVVSRYASTTVTSSVWNPLSVSKEAAFEVNLPSSAFISNFSITSINKEYIAQVKERAVAKKIYDEAKKKGNTAGFVATKERETEKFRVVLSIPPGARTSFCLTYEELLPRRLGYYELALGLRPTQPVQNLSLEVTVMERTGISFIRVLPLRTSRLMSNTVRGHAEAPPSTVIQHISTCAHIRYTPSWQQQTSISPKGLNGDFVIQYDVELIDLMGDVQIYNGYFVHYFAPRSLPVVPKDIIFVIDISGSMTGTKIKQTKQAMTTILSDLRENDHFNIITFSDTIHFWKDGGTVKATPSNVHDAQEFVRNIAAEGWTDINSALLSAGQLVKPVTSRGRRVPLVIFLTDGEATTGVISSETILQNARNALGSASLFGLAFGDDADFPLLRRLALENRGMARMVYEDSDAALQLKGFYDEVASPLLFDIQLSYLNEHTFDVTHSLFPNYFQGSELVVAGRVKPGVRDLKIFLSAEDSKQQVKLEYEVPTSSSDGNGTAPSLGCHENVRGISSFVHRLWAFFTIKELLQAKVNSTDPAVQRLLANKATNLSLKYNFVTPVTSLVVVKPDASETTPNFNVSSLNTTTTVPITTTTTGTPSTSSNIISQPHRLLLPRVSVSPVLVTKKPNSSPRAVKSKLGSAGKPLPSGLNNTSRPTQSSLVVKLLSQPAQEKTTLSMKSITQHPSLLKTAYPHCCENSSNPMAPSIKTVHATNPGKMPVPSPDSENTTVLSADLQLPNNSTLFHGLASVLPRTAALSSTDAGVEIENATLVTVTFVRIPNVMDTPKLEASELLDMDHVTDYEYRYYNSDLNDVSSAIVEPNSDYEHLHYDSDLNEALITHSPEDLFFSSVDGDPHFIVRLPRINHSLCFTIDGRPRDVLRLLEDPQKGIIVDGHLMWAPQKLGYEDRTRTYFSQLNISKKLGLAGGVVITVTMDLVVVDGEGHQTLPTTRPGSVVKRGLSVTVDAHLRCWVVLGRGLRFLVLFHHYKHPTYLQMAHLGFYIVDGQGLSPHTKGLLGQFQYSDMELVGPKDTQGADAGQYKTAMLRVGTSWVKVTLQNKTIKDSTSKQHLGVCWVVARVDVEKLLGHPYHSYVVEQL